MAEWPPLAPVPPPAVRRTLQHAEWETCLDAWLMLLGMRIETSDKVFKEVGVKDESAVSFLSSFYRQLATSGESGLHTGPKARQLRKLCFLLTRRLLLDASTSPVELLHWRVLGDMCCCYPSSSALKKLLSDAWNKHQDAVTPTIEKTKSSIIKQLSFSSSRIDSETASDIRLLTILASALPPCGQVLMAGSDFLDTFSDAYQALKTEDIRRIFVANAYVGLTSLLKSSKPNLSMLLDQLFSLKAAAGVGTSKTKKQPTLLSDLICSTDLLARLERYLSVHPQQRGQDLLSSLRSYQAESKMFHHRYQRQKKTVDKGKSRAPDVPGAGEEIHAHRMSLVTQVQDLFPDLGSGYIIRLLDHYGDNTETVVAHLLDGSLSPELQNLDQSEQLPTTHTIPDHHDSLIPRPTPPEIPSPDPTPARKNIFDKDVDIAELARSGEDDARGKLHYGRANEDSTADSVLADRSQHQTNKAAILSALAAFDSDDDERDDTYDVADVGGTVDAVTASADADAEADRRKAAEEGELSLFRAFKSNPALFARDSATRRSQPRASLKRETGMTDEAIEGWSVMLTRDPKRLARLEDKLAMSAVGPGGVLTQPELKATSYRKPTQGDGDSDEGEDGPPGGSFRGGRGGGGRGRGRGGRGRGGGGARGGGNPGGSSASQNPAVQHKRKEENKASRANHNRRQQRAKKMARGGGMPG